mmetsp:Transcript_15138/g.22729  ORF Transcript_15138/g.22729 Transcript_15138/m.22729 type:complete len:121 (-) Transcript_15138:415-777(-)
MNIVATARTMYGAHLLITVLLCLSTVCGQEVEASLLALLTLTIIGSIMWLLSLYSSGGDIGILCFMIVISLCSLLIGIKRFSSQQASSSFPHNYDDSTTQTIISGGHKRRIQQEKKEKAN